MVYSFMEIIWIIEFFNEKYNVLIKIFNNLNYKIIENN